MLDEKTKKALLNEYDQEYNYQQVLKNIKKMQNKRKSVSTFFRCKLIPCGITLVFCIIILQNSKIKNEVAKQNIDESEITKEYELADKNVETNVIQEENNEKEIENKIEEVNNIMPDNLNENNADINDIYNDQKGNVIPNNLIYKNIDCGEASWMKDPSISLNLIDDNTSIVKVKILSVGEAEFLPKQDKFYDPYKAYTPVKMKVLENMNENKLPEEITAYLTGGKVKISKMEKSISREQAQNLGINTLSEVEKENFIQYSTIYDYELKEGNEYIIIIKKVNNSLYRIPENGYDIFDINTKRNVITNNQLIY